MLEGVRTIARATLGPVVLRWKGRRARRAMREERSRGLKTVGVQFASPGFLQFFQPIHREILRRTDRISFYPVLDFPMPEAAKSLDVEPWRCLLGPVAREIDEMDLFVKTAMVTTPGPAHAVTVFTGHGFMAKFNNWLPKYWKELDVFFLNGPVQRGMMEKFLRDHAEYTSHIRLCDIGHPKNDSLLDGSHQREEVLRGAGLDPRLPTVIYAPAWDPGGALRTHGESIAEILLGIEGVNVIVKLHQTSLEPPRSTHYLSFTGGVDWLARFARFEGNPRFFLAREKNINPYLVASDLMVTDYSGVAWTFLLLDRPVVYLDAPEFFEKTLPSWGQDPHVAKTDEGLNAGRHVGRVVPTPAELPSAIRELLSGPDPRAKERKELARRLLYNPGRAAAAAADEILSLVGLGTGASRG